MLRETCVLMSVDTHTPVPYWLEMPVMQLWKWVAAKNAVYARTKQKNKK